MEVSVPYNLPDSLFNSDYLPKMVFFREKEQNNIEKNLIDSLIDKENKNLIIIAEEGSGKYLTAHRTVHEIKNKIKYYLSFTIIKIDSQLDFEQIIVTFLKILFEKCKMISKREHLKNW